MNTLIEKYSHYLLSAKTDNEAKIINEIISDLKQVSSLQPIKRIHDKKNPNYIPEWLTSDVRAQAKQTYNQHRNVNDHKIFEAAMGIRKAAASEGYKITSSKAYTLMLKFCL
jgi:hypothetical protein